MFWNFNANDNSVYSQPIRPFACGLTATANVFFCPNATHFYTPVVALLASVTYLSSSFSPTIFTMISLYVIFSTLPTTLLILAVFHPPFALHTHSRKIFSFLEYVAPLSHLYSICRFMLLSLYTLQSAVDARSYVFIRALNYY